MNKLKSAYMTYMKENKIYFSDRDELSLSVTYSCENAGSVTVYVRFDDDDSGCAHFSVSGIASCDASSRNAGLAACNQLNSRYRWVKFYLDSDNKVAADSDAMAFPETSGEVFSLLVQRMVTVIDAAYPKLLEASYEN